MRLLLQRVSRARAEQAWLTAGVVGSPRVDPKGGAKRNPSSFLRQLTSQVDPLRLNVSINNTNILHSYDLFV